MAEAWSVLGLAGVWGVAIGLLSWVGLHRLALRPRSRIERFGLTGPRVAENAASLEPREVLRAVGTRLESRWPGLAAHSQRQLELGGLAGRVSPAELTGWKALAALLGAIVALVVLPYLWPLFPIVAAGLGAFGWSVPTLWLAGLREQRTIQTQNSITSVMDLLALTLGAGMGLERALRLVCDRVDSALTEELRRVLTDMELGLSRREAFERMKARVGVDEVQALTSAIVQSEDLGASLVKTMQLQAHEARLTRRRRAEAAAYRAPVKMTIIMGLFTLPALFMILLGPVVFQLLQAQGIGGPP